VHSFAACKTYATFFAARQTAAFHVAELAQQPRGSTRGCCSRPAQAGQRMFQRAYEDLQSGERYPAFFAARRTAVFHTTSPSLLNSSGLPRSAILAITRYCASHWFSAASAAC
jgi:hypothetical protein